MSARKLNLSLLLSMVCEMTILVSVGAFLVFTVAVFAPSVGADAPKAFPSCNLNDTSSAFVCHAQFTDDLVKDDGFRDYETKRCCDLLTYLDCVKEALMEECTSSSEAYEYFNVRKSAALMEMNLNGETGVADCEKLTSVTFNGCLSRNVTYGLYAAIATVVMVFLGVILVILYCFCDYSTYHFPKEEVPMTMSMAMSDI